MGENMFEIISVNVFATNMSSFYLGSRGMLQIVLLLSVLRVTTVIKLSVIIYFHEVNLTFRLNKMMINTNCKESSVQLFC